MHFLPQTLLVDSTGRNVGKTEFATEVVRRFCLKHRIVGLKVTAVDKAAGACPRGGEGCGVCSSLMRAYVISEETGPQHPSGVRRVCPFLVVS